MIKIDRTMPRFLNTWTGDFEWHDPMTVRYAILSHTWLLPEDGGEQSYADVLALQAAAKAEPLHILQLAVISELNHLESLHPSHLQSAPKLPEAKFPPYTILSHPKLSDKIKGICMVAREAGYRLLWIDSCCIDKSSSAELSEAINSMFEWYRLSDVCYVYLADVPDDDDPWKPGSEFMQSRWHRRSWTLQELIAPAHVEFLTKTWRSLGTKFGLAFTLEAITGVDFDVLTGHATVDSTSVARRMSWAAEREATRIEDTAYSLMGLFNIHMSPIYGEGMNAFLRLQEEIVRAIPDQSIFAWGSSCTLRPLPQSECCEDTFDDSKSPGLGLFASSPRDFKGCRDITPITSRHFTSMLDLHDAGRENVLPLHCVFTPQGVLVQLLRINIAEIPKFLETLWRNFRLDHCQDCMRSRAVTLAFLQCQDENESLITLPLCQPHGETESKRGMFIGTHVPCIRWWHASYRTIHITGKDLAEALVHVSPMRFDTNLLQHYSAETNTSVKELHLQSAMPSYTLWRKQDFFRIAPRNIDTLRTLGFIVDLPLKVIPIPSRSLENLDVCITLRTHAQDHPRDGRRPQTIELTLRLTEYRGKPSVPLPFLVVLVKHFVGVPTGGRFPSSPPLLDNPLVAASSFGMKEIHCWQQGAIPSRAPWMRIAPEFEAILAYWEDEEVHQFRVLRVALYRRLYAGPFLPDDTTIYISIDISELCQHYPHYARISQAQMEDNNRRAREFRYRYGPGEVHGITRQLSVGDPDEDGDVYPPSTGPGSAVVSLKYPNMEHSISNLNNLTYNRSSPCPLNSLRTSTRTSRPSDRTQGLRSRAAIR